MRQRYRNAKPDRRAQTKVNLQKIRVARAQGVPFAADRSDVGNDDDVRIEHRRQRCQAVEAFHLMVSPVSSTATGRCQLIVDPWASTIALEISSFLEITLYGALRTLSSGSVGAL